VSIGDVTLASPRRHERFSLANYCSTRAPQCGSRPVARPPGPATCSSGRPIWNNDGDTATLIDPHNISMSRYRY